MKLFLLFAFTAFPLFSQCPAPDAGASSSMSAGSAAYAAHRYSEAAACFAQATKADPKSLQANLFYGYALQSQYIPGDGSSANLDVALSARQRFVDVLDIDPKNTDAMISIATLSYQQKKFDEARLWYGKLLDITPQNKEALYMLGVIAYAESNMLTSAARLETDMKPTDPGPIKDVAKRAEVRREDLDRVEEGIRNLNKALAIDPNLDDAMAYMDLLYRQRADLQADIAYRKDMATADQWRQKAIAAKNKKIKQVLQQGK